MEMQKDKRLVHLDHSARKKKTGEGSFKVPNHCTGDPDNLDVEGKNER